MRPKHFKMVGRVTEVRDNSFVSIVEVEGRECQAEFYRHFAEQDENFNWDDIEVGSIFSFHITKAGVPYLFWAPKQYWTKRQVKKIRQRARALRERLYDFDRD